MSESPDKLHDIQVKNNIYNLELALARAQAEAETWQSAYTLLLTSTGIPDQIAKRRQDALNEIYGTGLSAYQQDRREGPQS